MTDHDTTSSVPRWALYARGGTRNHVQAQLAELRDYVEEEAGTVVAECSDVGGIASGRAALLALLAARAVDRVLVVDLARLSRQNQDLAEVSAVLEQAAVELFVLEDIRDKDGVAVPVDLEVQIRAVFAELAEEGGPGFVLEMAPSWYHDGELSLLRRIMQAAQAKLAEVEGDTAPGFTVPPALHEARAACARAEKAFAEKLLELARWPDR